MMPGMPEKRTHDYVQHGVTSLFAAFDTAGFRGAARDEWPSPQRLQVAHSDAHSCA